jgi:hypothetical protein
VAARFRDERFGSALCLFEALLPLLAGQLGVGKFVDFIGGATIRCRDKQPHQQRRTPSRHDSTGENRNDRCIDNNSEAVAGKGQR